MKLKSFIMIAITFIYLIGMIGMVFFVKPGEDFSTGEIILGILIWTALYILYVLSTLKLKI